MAAVSLLKKVLVWFIFQFRLSPQKHPNESPDNGRNWIHYAGRLSKKNLLCSTVAFIDNLLMIPWLFLTPVTHVSRSKPNQKVT